MGRLTVVGVIQPTEGLNGTTCSGKENVLCSATHVGHPVLGPQAGPYTVGAPGSQNLDSDWSCTPGAHPELPGLQTTGHRLHGPPNPTSQLLIINFL